MQKVAFAGCLGLSPVISTQFTLKMCGSLKSPKNSLKPPILEFKVVQNHRCWYRRIARQQCHLWCAASMCLSATVLVLDLSTVAWSALFEGGNQIWCTRTEDSLNLGGRILHRWNLRLMPNISYAGCPGLSWMVSVQFTLEKCIAAWDRKKIQIHYKPLFWGFKVVQGHRCWYHGKARQQCLLW